MDTECGLSATDAFLSLATGNDFSIISPRKARQQTVVRPLSKPQKSRFWPPEHLSDFKYHPPLLHALSPPVIVTVAFLLSFIRTASYCDNVGELHFYFGHPRPP